MQHIMCNTKNTRLLLKYFTYEQLLMRLVLMRFRCCATHPNFFQKMCYASAVFVLK
jgi:hypothetical protein